MPSWVSTGEPSRIPTPTTIPHGVVSNNSGGISAIGPAVTVTTHIPGLTSGVYPNLVAMTLVASGGKTDPTKGVSHAAS